MHGKIFAMVRVAAVVLALVFFLTLPVEEATGGTKPAEPESAGEATGGTKPAEPESAGETTGLEGEFSPESHYGSCTLCYTCGRYWPYRRATYFVPGGRAIWELGSRCATPSTYRHDSSPYLCCNN